MRRTVLVALVALHGAFAAGMIPVLNDRLAERAPIAFALYFAAMVAGQWAIWRFPSLSRARWALAAWEAQFALALLLMAAFPTELGLTLGRIVEGVGSGATLPLIFQQVVRLEGWGAPARRVAWMNSAYALGFVAGPFAVSTMHPVVGTSVALAGFAAVFALCAVLFAAVAPALRAPAAGDASSVATGIRTFLPLFTAKATYGFMLALLGGNMHLWFPQLGIGWVMLMLAGVFVAGQVVAAMLVKRAPSGSLHVGLPLVLGAAALWLALGGAPVAIFGVALAHSLLALFGYHQFHGLPDDARRFALYNLLSDPGMILGATLAIAGPTGGLGLVALAVVPAVLSRAQAGSAPRARIL